MITTARALPVKGAMRAASWWKHKRGGEPWSAARVSATKVTELLKNLRDRAGPLLCIYSSAYPLPYHRNLMFAIQLLFINIFVLRQSSPQLVENLRGCASTPNSDPHTYGSREWHFRTQDDVLIMRANRISGNERQLLLIRRPMERRGSSSGSCLFVAIRL